MLAVRRGLDLFGVLVLAVAAAMAGGLIRDGLLGVHPPTTLQNGQYIVTALLSGVTVFFAHRWIEKVNRPVMVLDAIGLGFFAVSGCTKALEMGLAWLPALLLGVVTAIGGGAVRDVLVTEVPRVLREEVYALAAVLGAGLVILGHWLNLPPQPMAGVAILATVIFRLLSVKLGWRAPKAPGS